ncbi:MAG: M48 family metallopeptidase [Proteobacteria bacterium]|nr:M48 family metallopeptidase [Pseudomonadota bacterium]MBU0965571.1 M48 family metallopeptidase [Pseudomonadota bacterium]
MMGKYLQLTLLCCLCLLGLAGCEDTDVRMAAEAGLDAARAVTLSDETVRELALQSAQFADGKQRLAAPGDPYAKRLQRLVGEHQQEGALRFNYKVYLADEVNAFALADGTIRIYSGLMDMLDDGELHFVIGHEMGHVAGNHIRKKIQLAYAASAMRKGIASLNSAVGELARSQLGAFSELLMSAQFSQLEEKEADDYGLAFLKKNGYETRDGVTALRKLAGLGNDHSFLSSHPAPDKRADRLELQLAGKAVPIEESRRNLSDRLTGWFAGQFPGLYERLNDFFPWLERKEERSAI